MTKKKSEKDSPELCMNCANWDAFEKNCWFFWEEKKECANHSDGFKSVKDNFEIDSMNYFKLE